MSWQTCNRCGQLSIYSICFVPLLVGVTYMYANALISIGYYGGQLMCMEVDREELLML